jgi:protein TonB
MRWLWSLSEESRRSSVAVLVSAGLHAGVLLSALHLSERVPHPGNLSEVQPIQVSLISLAGPIAFEQRLMPEARYPVRSPSSEPSRFPTRKIAAQDPQRLREIAPPAAIQTSHSTAQTYAADNVPGASVPVGAPTNVTRSAPENKSTVIPPANLIGVEVEKAQPDYAYNPQPDYPLLLRDQGVGGVVWLRVWVEPDGSARNVSLLKGSGYRLLDEAALRAVRSWRFIPARRGEHTLASWVEFPIRFSLQD